MKMVTLKGQASHWLKMLAAADGAHREDLRESMLVLVDMVQKLEARLEEIQPGASVFGGEEIETGTAA